MKKNSKRILSLLVSLAAAAAFCFGAAADNTTSTVTYDATKNLQVTGSSVSFTDLLPGQQRAQTITITNNSGSTADFYLDVSVLESLEKAASSTQGNTVVTAYTLGLTVTDPYTGSPNAATPVNTIFGGANNSGTVGGNNSNGLYDFDAAVTLSGSAGTSTAGSSGSWLNVAHLENGQSATITFTAAVDRNATGNAYQTALAQVKFDIRVQDAVSHTETVTQRSTIVRNIVERVRTGDTAPLLMLGLVLIVGIVLLVVLIRRSKKHGKTE